MIQYTVVKSKGRGEKGEEEDKEEDEEVEEEEETVLNNGSGAWSSTRWALV